MKALNLPHDLTHSRLAAYMLATAAQRHALLKLGPMVTDMRGSIGGTVFARNRGGIYARARVVPINPSTSRQTVVRAALGSLAQLWTTTLTDVQRAAWELYAANVLIPNKLGEPRALTGQQMYVRTNTLALDCDLDRIDDAPTNFTVGPTITPTFTPVPASNEITMTDLGGYDPSTDGEIGILVQVGTPQNGGVVFFKSPFRKALGADYAAIIPFPVTITSPFPFEAGQALFVRTANVTIDGRVGVPVVQRFLVA